MFNIIRKYKGKEEVVFTGDRSKANDRLRTLRSSNNGAAYKIVPAETNEKFQKKRSKWGHD